MVQRGLDDRAGLWLAVGGAPRRARCARAARERHQLPRTDSLQPLLHLPEGVRLQHRVDDALPPAAREDFEAELLEVRDARAGDDVVAEGQGRDVVGGGAREGEGEDGRRSRAEAVDLGGGERGEERREAVGLGVEEVGGERGCAGAEGVAAEAQAVPA